MRIEAYPDRLRVTNPGGLHGEISRTRLFSEPLTSSRNSHLARLLEDVDIPRTIRTVCENRGSGLLAVAHKLAKIVARGRDEFDKDWVLRSAAERQLEIIGEAAGGLSEDLAERRPDWPIR